MYSTRVKSIFQKLHEFPDVIELDEREDGEAIHKALITRVGRTTVPQVFIYGNHMGGSDDIAEAYRSGRLSRIFDNGEL
eukprot:c21508_g2_i1 orf=218-454(-)